MSISRNKMQNLYNKRDSDRFSGASGGNGRDKYADEQFLTSGPGTYRLRVRAVKMGISEKPGKNHGEEYVAFEFVVDQAEDDSTLEVGTIATFTNYLTTSMNIKRCFEAGGAILGLAPAVEVPEGHEFAGNILPIVSYDHLEELSDLFPRLDPDEEIGEDTPEVYVWCTIVPREHNGTTYHNPYFDCDEDGEKSSYAGWEEMQASDTVDLDQICKDVFGTRKTKKK